MASFLLYEWGGGGGQMPASRGESLRVVPRVYYPLWSFLGHTGAQDVGTPNQRSASLLGVFSGWRKRPVAALGKPCKEGKS
jgi:hypothetical protein